MPQNAKKYQEMQRNTKTYQEIKKVRLHEKVPFRFMFFEASIHYALGHGQVEWGPQTRSSHSHATGKWVGWKPKGNISWGCARAATSPCAGSAIQNRKSGILRGKTRKIALLHLFAILNNLYCKFVEKICLKAP